MEDREKETCLELLQTLKEEKKGFSKTKFRKLFALLNKYAKLEGLVEDDFNLLADIIVNSNLGAMNLVSLIKCLIPRHKISEKSFKLITTWCLANANKLPITVFMIIIQWIIGLWEYQLIDKKIINIYYGILFYIMLKKQRMERHIARLIYVLTKPEDVTRRDVLRLLDLQRIYKNRQKHITALLLLFKSYRPELVPERISAINIESAWKPIPEELQIRFQNAKARLTIQQTKDLEFKPLEWHIPEFSRKKKTMKPLLPSIRYFQIGSNIFKEGDTKAIFTISNLKELGKSQLNIEMPCNAVSLLGNTAGYHLLTFANFHYQRKFSYNLYNTFIQAFMLESEQISTEEKDKLLEMTIEFSRYMQQGILVVKHFLGEYLDFNTGSHRSKLLGLLQWMTSVSVTDIQERVLIPVKRMFYESGLDAKCEIIETMRMFMLNLFVSHEFKESHRKTPTLFLGQGQMDKFEDIISIVTKFVGDLIISGLNIHSYNVLLLSEALSFYEGIHLLENQSTVQSFTLAPPAVIYGGFITRSCAILSRTCNLLLKYYDMSVQFKKQKLQSSIKIQLKMLDDYALDIVGALWYDEAFSERSKAYFSKSISDEMLKDVKHCNLDSLLNVSNHYAVLPYKSTLKEVGLKIKTNEDAIYVGFYYYSPLIEFLAAFTNLTTTHQIDQLSDTQ